MHTWLTRIALTLSAAAASFPLHGADALEDGFRTPPASSRPRVWWHWMNGNVTAEGIDLDLAWLKRVGIGGVQVFDAALATPVVVPHRLAYMTPEWNTVFSQAVKRADELDLEFTIASSPGWSESGGPWVGPEQAMKKLVWSETPVSGGRRFDGKLVSPPSTTGPFQNVPAIMGGLFGHNGAQALPSLYADTAVVAFRSPEVTLPTPVATSSEGPVDASILMDGDYSTRTSLKISTDADAWILLDYGDARTFRSVSVATGAVPVFNSPLAQARLESSADGSHFSKVVDVRLGEAPQQTAAFPAVTARYFRLVLSPTVAAAPALFAAAAPGADFSALSSLLPDAGASAPRVVLSEVRLSTAPKINQFELKAGFGVVPDYYALDGSSEPVKGVDPRDIVDLTHRMDPTGRLRWNPPKGHWTVLRLGYSLIGVENHPATAEATGLEVDKLDASAVRTYIDTYLDRYQAILGADSIGHRGVRAMLNDSTEVGPQNWTGNILPEFARRRGYDPRPWLPTLTGVIVGDEAKSSAFLYDFRRTLAELTQENHYAVIAAEAHARGLVTYGEALENGRPSLGDDLEMRRYTSIPMAAMWTFKPGAGAQPTFEADVRGAASVAHVYGQNLVAAESMTVALAPWNFAPVDLKSTIDLEFALGVNLPVIHTSVHQPLSDRKPGLSLSIFGQYFNRNDSWAAQARPWIDYLSRNAFLLQQGRNVADVAYFYGEEAPLTGLYGRDRALDLPRGYAVDFVNANMLAHQLQVDGGALVAPSGARYRLLYLGGSSRHMTLDVLLRIGELVRLGAVVAGPPPESSPSLLDDPVRFAAEVKSLWGPPGSIQTRGAGKVIAADSPLDALRKVGTLPDFEMADPAVDANVLYVHRELPDGADIYFLNNRRSRPERFTAEFRCRGRVPEVWRAETGAHAPVSFTIDGVRTLVPLTLRPDESVFVVFRSRTEQTSARFSEALPQFLSRIDGPWSLSFEAGHGAPDHVEIPELTSLTESPDSRIKYYSGEVTYERNFERPRRAGADARLELDLGEVRDLAEVRVNGELVGTPWHPPYRMDITSATRAGLNRLSVKVANTWVNRLIGDQQSGASRVAFTVIPTYLADAPLRPAGLVGPVMLYEMKRAGTRLDAGVSR